MNHRWQTIGALGAGLLLLGGGAANAAAVNGNDQTASPRLAIMRGIGHGIASLVEIAGIEDESAAPGTIDDGEELLPQAGITLERAITAARATGPGDLGEIDIEQYHGQLVFNVDLGDRDVKVDAQTGAVLGAESDD